MLCNHVKPSKISNHPDPLGVAIDYMKSHDAFEPIKTSEYGLCHFYEVGLTGEFLKFPEPCKPATSQHICHLLTKAHDLVWPNLVVALSQDMVTAIALLMGLHNHVSLQQLKMETDEEAGKKGGWKLSLCPFWQQ